MRVRIASVLVLLASATGSVAADPEYFAVLGHEIARLASERATVSAVDAIDTARKLVGEPTFILCELVADGNVPIYEVVFIDEKGQAEVELDAVSGKQIPLPPEEFSAERRAEQLKLRSVLMPAKFSLRQAVEAAMAEVKSGKVVRAQAEAVDGTPRFRIELLADGAFKMVTLNADGKVIGVEASEDEPGGRAWTFDRVQSQKPPNGWSWGYTGPVSGSAVWTVERDAKPMTGPHVLRVGALSDTRVYNVGIIAGGPLDDVDVRTRIRADRGQIDQGGGLIWRCKDPNNYYICRINPLEGNFRVYRVVGGKREQLQSVDVKTETGKWYAVRAKMVGDHIMCFLDGKKLLDVRDSSITAPGRVGLWTKADASSSFDNIAVRKAVASPSDNEPVARPESVKPSARDHEEVDDDD